MPSYILALWRVFLLFSGMEVVLGRHACVWISDWLNGADLGGIKTINWVGFYWGHGEFCAGFWLRYSLDFREVCGIVLFSRVELVSCGGSECWVLDSLGIGLWLMRGWMGEFLQPIRDCDLGWKISFFAELSPEKKEGREMGRGGINKLDMQKDKWRNFHFETKLMQSILSIQY